MTRFADPPTEAGFDVWPLVLRVTERDPDTGKLTVTGWMVRDMAVYPVVQYRQESEPDWFRFAWMTGNLR